MAVSISLKIPDNAAYTALVALRRLGVETDRVARSEILFFPDEDPEALAIRVMNDETLFNPNKHRLRVLDSNAPRPGEVWILPLEGGRATAWRLLDAKGLPVEDGVLQSAVERLLCNPAIEKAVTISDISGASERNGA
jgi:phosphoribosylformylglycinamidine (FGAM) synthase PurS component